MDVIEHLMKPSEVKVDLVRKPFFELSKVLSSLVKRTPLVSKQNSAGVGYVFPIIDR